MAPSSTNVDPLDLVGTIARQRAQVERAIAVAERLARAGRPSAAANAAQAAAESAWLGHCGLHGSDALEALLVELAADVVDLPAALPVAAPDDDPRVLVVLTEAYETGGHSRQAARMLANLASLRPALALTSRHPVPAFLTDALALGGGDLHQLSVEDDELLARAARLRALVRCHDVVLLMAHPWDATPTLAAAGLGHDGIVVVSHADHTFWLGRAVANVVADPRPSAARLSTTRRGIEAERSLVLPLPLDPPSPSAWTRAAARAHLGLPDDAVVLLTIGSTDKYGEDGDLDWFRAVHPTVARDPRVQLLAVGCERTGGFAALEAATGGRARAVGKQADVAPYLAAADIYLDSFPFAGANATLEAGLAGLPVVKLLADPDGAEGLFSFDYPGLVGARLEARSDEQVHGLLERLAADPAARRDAGEALRRQILAQHGPAAWQQAFGVVLARLTELAGTTPTPAPAFEGPPAALDRWITRWQVLGAITPPPSWCLAHHALTTDAVEASSLRDVATQRWVELGTETMVGVSVAACGPAEDLMATLQAVLDASAGVGPLALSVVDCGLEPEALALLEELPDVATAASAGAPADVAWTTVLGHTEGDAVVVVPSGLCLQPGALAALVEALVQQPDVDGVVATGSADGARPAMAHGLAAMAVRRLAALVGGELVLGVAPAARAHPAR